MYINAEHREGTRLCHSLYCTVAMRVVHTTRIATVYTTRIATVQARIAPARTEAYETPRASNRGVQGVAHQGQRSGRLALHRR